MTEMEGTPLRVGFLPLLDCAPVAVAWELGLFARHGLNVELKRENDWGVLQDKIVRGELHAAHAPVTFPFITRAGYGCEPAECLSALVLSAQGNAVTLSREIHAAGVRDAKDLKAHLMTLRGKRTLTLAVVHRASTHAFILRKWLNAGGIHPERDLRLVVLPPEQMYPGLKLGVIDGFCAGEPWNSVAVEAGAGWCAAVSGELFPGHPEKVLFVRADFARNRHHEHLGLVAALLEACAYCDEQKNWPTIAEILAHFRYVNAPAECLLSGRGLPFHLGPARSGWAGDFIRFHRHGVNEPTMAKANWIILQLMVAGAIPYPAQVDADRLRASFRPDLYAEAVDLLPRTVSVSPEPTPNTTTLIPKSLYETALQPC